MFQGDAFLAHQTKNSPNHLYDRYGRDGHCRKLSSPGTQEPDDICSHLSLLIAHCGLPIDTLQRGE